MYEIIVCPLKKLYQCAADGDMTDVAVLAVSSYEINQQKLQVFGKTLCMSFNDIIDVTDSTAFSGAIADKIAAYIKSLPHQLDSLFVCCDSGESRSTAMAAAILRYNGGNEMDIWKNPHYHPNPLVYKLLCKALGVAADDREIEEKIKINKKSFSDALQG